MSRLSVTITAADRLDLFEKTIKSFLEFNTYPIEKYIVRDDSGLESVWHQTKMLLLDLDIPFKLLPGGQVGQAASIDKMMNEVDTEYVFHLEDDWEFDRSGFIEDCFEVMSEIVSQVRVRHRDDGSAAQTVFFNETADRCTNHLFSFNPHLRRTDFIDRFEGKNETMLGEWVTKEDYTTLWLKEGAARHIGQHKTTNRPGTPYEKGVKKA